MLTHFFELPSKDHHQTLKRFIEVLRNWHPETNDHDALKAQLQNVGLWDQKTFPALLTFLSKADHSDWFIRLHTTKLFEDAENLLADHFFVVTAPLTKTALTLLASKAMTPEAILHQLSYSYCYGLKLTQEELNRWLQWGQLLGFWRVLGSHLALGLRGETYLDHPLPDIDKEETESVACDECSITDEVKQVITRTEPLETQLKCICAPNDLSFEEVNLTFDVWSKDSSRAFFRLNAFAFLYLYSKKSNLFHKLWTEFEPLLDALQAGVMPKDLHTISDVHALMKLSLIARRQAEHPDLLTQIQACKDGRQVIELLNETFNSLFFMEPLIILQGLDSMQALALPQLERWASLPDREIRDSLYRWGYLASPYATTTTELLDAAEAAYKLVAKPRADLSIRTFAHSAGCASPCPMKAQCTVTCRERDDRG